MEENKSGFYMMAIVAIVAVVGIVTMILFGAGARAGVSNTDSTGQVMMALEDGSTGDGRRCECTSTDGFTYTVKPYYYEDCSECCDRVMNKR